MLNLDEARQAKQKAIKILDGCSQVEGVGIAPTEHGYSVKVNISAPLPVSIEQKLRQAIGSVWIEIVGTGAF